MVGSSPTFIGVHRRAIGGSNHRPSLVLVPGPWFANPQVDMVPPPPVASRRSTHERHPRSRSSTGVGAQSEDWTTIIRPQRRGSTSGWATCGVPRLIAIFVRRDFAATYKQTILGPFWYLLRPLFSTVVFTVIFWEHREAVDGRLPPFCSTCPAR